MKANNYDKNVLLLTRSKIHVY